MDIMIGSGCKALAVPAGFALETIADVKDLIPAAWAGDCQAVIVPMACLPEAFFDLKTGFAGEVLQKFTNYNLKFAVTGDFSGFLSKSLRDFIYESNKGNQVFFKASLEEAMTAMEKALTQ